jgi:ectoine hydroxylase-related dioxygenase (phytanoyl-CoA dioxygenase family)
VTATSLPARDGLRRFAIHDVAGMVAALDEDGFALAAGAFTAALAEKARAMIDALQPRHWDEVHANGGRSLDRYLCVFNRDPFWLEFLDRPGIIDVAEAVLGRDCHVIGETAWRSLPGFQGDSLHVDYLPIAWAAAPAAETPRVPIFIFTAHFYLCDVAADLAPTCVLRGSHRAGRPPRAQESQWNGREATPVLARAGECLLFRSDLWHSGSANRHTNAIRYLLQVHYGRREMSQHFSPWLDWRFNPAVIAAATKRQRRLLGDHEPGAYD